MGLVLILYWKTCKYRKIILLNLKKCLCTWWPIFLLSQKIQYYSIFKDYFVEFKNVFVCLMTIFFTVAKDIVLFKIYFKSLVFSKQNAVVLRFETVHDVKISIWHQFLWSWSCCFLFKLLKYVSVVVLLLLIFSFLLTASNTLSTRIIVFFLFFILFFHGCLMEINSTLVCFRSRMMSCFDYEKTER